MKNKIILTTLFSFFSAAVIAQWPVSGGVQGTITGTIGEVRNATTGRIHNGTDVIGTSATVYSIQNDEIMTINQGASFGANTYIVMRSGITYIHVTINPSIAANPVQIQQINNGSRIVTLTQGQAFATMLASGTYNGARHAQHVHMVNGNENFLTDGFGVTGFTFTDDALPRYSTGADSVAFFKDQIAQTWQAPTRYNTRVTDEGLPVNQQPIILWGKIDIVANTWQPGINANGSSNTGYHLAPKYLGYQMRNTSTNVAILDRFENVQFENGFGGGGVSATDLTVFRRIHSRNSTISNPYFIITNPFQNSTSTEGNIATDQQPDGDYTITVRSQGAKGNTANAPDLNVDKVCKVRLDNYKTYVQKVEVADANNLVKYAAEWSKLTRPGDGSIILDKKNNEPFKSGTQATIKVTSSEKLPSLTLALTGSKNIDLTPVGADGKEWTGSFTIPSSSSKKVSLTFKSDNRLYGLAQNQEAADVKRDQTNGKFSDKQSSDKSHELKVCPADYPLSLDVNVQNGQDVVLTAAGGTEPYEYSIDAMPVKANHKSTFGSINTFTIEFDKNYLFKVRDAGGCQSEKYYTLPKVPCDALTNAGGVGTDIKQVNLGNISGTVTVNYEMYTVPDQITVTYRGVSQTTGIVSGSGSLSFQHTPQAGLSNLVTITMYAPSPGTAWTYQVVCPTANRLSNPDATATPALFSYHKNQVYISPLKGGEQQLYRLTYRVVGTQNWTELKGIGLPYTLETRGRELEVKVFKDETTVASRQLAINPNPAQGPVQIMYMSEKEGKIQIIVYDQMGRQLLVKKQAVKKGVNLTTWQPNDGLSGMVLISVEQDGQTLTKKVIIEK